MNFNFFSFFKKQKSDLIVPDSILVKRLKSLSDNSNLKVFSNVDIYYHAQRHPIELMLYDNTRGLYIFEIKKWSFNDLKNATIEKAQNQEHGKNTLAFDKTQELIKKKFNEIEHNDGPVISNFLLMENLSVEEYEHLDDSFKELLPQEKIIFNDSSSSDIFKKLESIPVIDSVDSTNDTTLTTLLTQYTKLQENGEFSLCSDDEINFLNTQITPSAYFDTNFHSGKTSLLILKAIQEVFTKKAKKVLIIKPSVLARDIAYKKYLDILEHAMIEFDITAIELLTPTELINKHLQKLKKPAIEHELEFDPKLLKKPFDIADLILCDDVELLTENFITYLQHIQKNKQLLFINLETNSLDIDIEFIQTIPLAKCLYLINQLLTVAQPQDILVVSNPDNQQKLEEDLEYFIETSPLNLDGQKTLLEQNIHTLKLATYHDMFELSAKHIILLDLCEYNEKQIEYALNLTTSNAYLLYENPCGTVEMLKEKYESKQD